MTSPPCLVSVAGTVDDGDDDGGDDDDYSSVGWQRWLITCHGNDSSYEL